MELWSTEHWRNAGTLVEQRSTDKTIKIQCGTGEHQRNNGTTKQHQEILPIQNKHMLSK